MTSIEGQEDATEPGQGASLAERLAFERLLADLSTTFANVASDRVISDIEAGLNRLVEFLGFERSTLGEFTPDGTQLIVLCSIAVPGVEATPRGPLPGQLSWFIGELRAGRVVMLPSMPDDLPPGARDEIEYARKTGLSRFPCAWGAGSSGRSRSVPSDRPARGRMT